MGYRYVVYVDWWPDRVVKLRQTTSNYILIAKRPLPTINGQLPTEQDPANIYTVCPSTLLPILFLFAIIIATILSLCGSMLQIEAGCTQPKFGNHRPAVLKVIVGFPRGMSKEK